MAPNHFILNVEQEHPDCLRDESRLTGRAEALAFPENESDILSCLLEANRQGQTVTIQGARTGIAGGAVPQGGLALNLSRMNRVLGLRRRDDAFFLRVQPGLLLSDLRRQMLDLSFDNPVWSESDRAAWQALQQAGPHFFPPDPTEPGATLGGMVATNASGARSFFYGPTRRYIQSMRVALADGSVLGLARGAPRAVGRAFTLVAESGRTLAGELPRLPAPCVKNAAGYFIRESMDLMDLFIGAEGTLGVVAELELILRPAPPVCWGLLCFVPDEARAVDLARRVRARQGGERRPDATEPARRQPAQLVAMEFFDCGALDLLRRQQRTGAPLADGIPALPAAWQSALYLEYHGDREPGVETLALEAAALLEACGGDPESVWMATEACELERLKHFRHAVPEAVNLAIDARRQTDPDITKLGTDLAVPDAALQRTLELYSAGLRNAKLDHVKFGHLGDNHIHVNILPRNAAQYETGKRLVLEWARAVTAMNGTVSAEHGIGKLKTALLAEMVGPQGVERMRRLKQVFDPGGRLNPGTLMPPGPANAG